MQSKLPWAQKLERYITLYQIMLVPTRDVAGMGTSPFFYFIGQGMIREVMVCIKVGCEVTDQGSYENLREANALHVACLKGQLKLLELLLETRQFPSVNTLDQEL